MTLKLRHPKDKFQIVERPTGADIKLNVEINDFVGHLIIPFALGTVSLAEIAESFNKEIKR